MKKIGDIVKFILLILVPTTLVFYKIGQQLNLEKYFFVAKKTITQSTPLKKVLLPEILWLSTSGNKIINEKGETVVLRGVNIASINWGFEKWNPKAVNYAVKEWNSNVIRTRIYPDDFVKDKTEFFNQLEKQIVDPARRNGVYVVLHSFMSNSPDDLPEQKTIEMWQAVADFYKNDSLILYDLIPEPHNTTKEKLRQAYLNLIPKVRLKNPKSLIFVTGLGWGREINSYLENPIPFENIVYRSNPYNRAAEFEGLFGEIALKYPVFLTEFGADAYPEMSKQSVQDLLDYADNLGLSWTAWHFQSQGCPCLLSNWKTFEASDWGKLVYEALQKQPKPPIIDQLEEIKGNELVIYDDIFHHGFIEQGWEREVDLQNTQDSYKGSASIKIEFKKGFAGLGLHTYYLVSSAGYRALVFNINFSDNEPFDLIVQLDNSQEQKIGEVLIDGLKEYGKNTWLQISIPFEDFGLVNELISGLSIRDASGMPHGQIFIDEIRLVK